MTLTERIAALPLALRRVIASCLLLAAVLAVWGFVAVPLHWIVTSQDDWRSAARTELARARGWAARLPEARANVAGLSSRPVWKYFYRAGQGEDAGALIQGDVRTLCDGNGIAVQSVTTLPAENVGRLRKFGARVSLSANAEQLAKLVAALRQHTPYLRLERLTASSPQTQQADQNAPITLIADIAGYSAGAGDPRAGHGT